MRPANKTYLQVRHYTICTDASTSGGGGIVYDNTNGGLSTYGGKWQYKQSATQIAELEALALVNSWEQWKATLGLSKRCLDHSRLRSDKPTHDADAYTATAAVHIRFMVDSSVLLWALTKRQSGNHLVWKYIRPILKDISRLNTLSNTTYSAAYVHTNLNPADELSRARTLNPTKVHRSIVQNTEMGMTPEGITWLCG
ncbi:unnamed protein product [Trypanosoma congolense IL3000]|uniref:WGS project CAEQ00000000 data, annotated contig 1771 n=1 Tax=Trypanosoma congolense (strain IL3000) TaxID=1068625 RepID=F9W8S4_TRYCI|nr:unnamed protein product [Trypanosoma congolense IL3000]